MGAETIRRGRRRQQRGGGNLHFPLPLWERVLSGKAAKRERGRLARKQLLTRFLASLETTSPTRGGGSHAPTLVLIIHF